MKTILLDGREFETRDEDPLSIATSGWYETLLSSLLLAVARPNHCLVDVGANVGWYSCLLAPCVKNVVSLEPEDENHRILLLNAARHPNIRCLKLAAGSSESEATLAINPSNTADSRLDLGGQTWSKQTVKVVRLDDIGCTADILKIDVQGHEMHVLLGGAETLKSATAVAIELTPGMMPGGKADAAETVRLLCDAGFRRFTIIKRQSRAETTDRSGLERTVLGLGNRKHIDVLCLK